MEGNNRKEWNERNKNPGKIKENIDQTGLPIAECGSLHSTARQAPAAATCLCTAEWRQLSQ